MRLKYLPVMLVLLVPSRPSRAQEPAELVDSLAVAEAKSAAVDSLSIWNGVPPLPASSSLAPQLVRVIEREQIVRSHETNLGDFLEKVGWLYSRRRGPLGNGGSFHFLDHASRHLIVLVDGEVWSDPQDRAPNLTLIPLSKVERVELLDGPSAALHPLGGGGGILNIVTRQTIDPKAKVETEVGQGNDEYRIVRARFQSPRSAFVIRTFYDEYKTRGYAYEVNNDFAAQTAPFRAKNFSWEIQTRLGRRSKITSLFERYQEDFDGTFDLPPSGIERKGVRIHLGYVHAERFRLRLYETLHETGTDIERTKNTRLGLTATATWKLGGRYLLQVSADGGRTTGDNLNPDGTSNPRRKNLMARAYFGDEGSRSLQRSAWLGTYADDLSGAELTGGVGVTWRGRPNLILWTSAFREAMPATLGEVGGPPERTESGQTVLPNGELEPEGLLGFRLGGRLQGKESFLSLFYFYTETDNPVEPLGPMGAPPDLIPSGDPLELQNSLRNVIDSRGVALDSRLPFRVGTSIGHLLASGYYAHDDKPGLPLWAGDLVVELDVPLFRRTTAGRLRWAVHGASGDEAFQDFVVNDGAFSFLVGEAQVYASLYNAFDLRVSRDGQFLVPPRTWILGLIWNFTN